jgi:predicted Rossmann fold nucleotide-binding protein DprA/Smf involved in DNA uptake
MTFDDIWAARVPSGITITGTRATEHRSLGDYGTLFADYLAPFARLGTQFLLGGALGIDSLALLWLASETEASLTVVVPGTLPGQPADAQHAVAAVREQGRLAKLVELDHPDHPSIEGYHARNRWMVDRSDFVIGFPRRGDMGSGTWHTLEYAAGQGKPRLIVPA